MPTTRRDLLCATAASAAAMTLWPRGLPAAFAEERQPAAGLISSEPATTFAEHVAKINANPKFFEALAKQPDKGPIINLNFICCRPRGNADRYNLYGAVAGREIVNIGGSFAFHAEGVTTADPVFKLSDKWDVIALPVYPRRHSYLQLQKSKDYQLAIPDRVAGTYERLLYVLSDDRPYFEGTTSIKQLHESKGAFPVEEGQVWVSELLRFNPKGGRDAFRRYAEAFQKILQKIGGKAAMSVRAEMPIVSEKIWDHFTLVQYPSLNALEEMFRSDDWQAANADRLKALDRSLAVAGKPQKLPS